MLALVVIFGLGLAAFASTVRVGDLVLHDYCYCWDSTIPQISFANSPCQIGPKTPFPVEIKNLACGDQAWLYAFVEGNKLVYYQGVLRNGVYRIILPSLYNEENWKPGWNRLTIVLSSTQSFNVGDGHRPQIITSQNFFGYPCSGYIIVRQISFYVPYSPCLPCWWWCCGGKDP